MQVSLDTSFLISFADPTRPHHAAALEYFRHCLAERFPMWISTVAAGEFEVGQPIEDLPLQNFRIQPYNLPHARKAATLFRAARAGAGAQESRRIIVNDLKILAQAEEDGIPFVIPEDENTLSRMAERLRANGLLAVRVLLLRDGFLPENLTNAGGVQISLPVGSASEERGAGPVPDDGEI